MVAYEPAISGLGSESMKLSLNHQATELVCNI